MKYLLKDAMQFVRVCCHGNAVPLVPGYVVVFWTCERVEVSHMTPEPGGSQSHVRSAYFGFKNGCRRHPSELLCFSMELYRVLKDLEELWVSACSRLFR